MKFLLKVSVLCTVDLRPACLITSVMLLLRRRHLASMDFFWNINGDVYAASQKSMTTIHVSRRPAARGFGAMRLTC